MFKKILLPFLFISWVLSLGLIGYSSFGLVICLLPFCFVSFILGLKDPSRFLQGVFFLLPLVGFLNNSLQVPGFFVGGPIFYAGLLGISFQTTKEHSAARGLDTWLWSWIGWIFLSSLYAAFSLGFLRVPLLAVVRDLPWAHVRLINVLGWIARGFLLGTVGPLFFMVLRGKLGKIEFSNAFHRSFYGLTICALVAFLQASGFHIAGSENFVGRGLSALNGTFSDQNALGSFNALLLPFCVFSSPLGFKSLLVLTAVLANVGFSCSRSAFLIVFGGIFFGLFLSGKSFLKYLRPVAILFLLILLFGLWHVKKYGEHSRLAWFYGNLAHAAKNLTGPEAGKIETAASIRSNLFGDRLILWQGGWVTIRHNPILGVGVGSYLVKMPDYKAEIPTVVNDNPGSQYLLILAEQGVPGLLFFILVVGQIVVSGWKGYRRKPEPLIVACLSALAGLFISMNFGSHLQIFEVNVLFWTYLIILDQRETT